jgi:hypothetical protein
MNYHWTTCPNCLCQVAVNWSVREEGITGSLRRWSADRSINDGRPFVVPRAPAGTPPPATCVCGAPIVLPDRPDAVGGERADDLRVTLTTD